MLGRYARELKVITLPEAVKKMTSMNADKIGITDRGRLKEGLAADVTIFDQDHAIDRATFEQPQQFPVGIKYVIVNRVVTVDNEQHTGALAGQVIYGPGKRRTGPSPGPLNRDRPSRGCSALLLQRHTPRILDKSGADLLPIAAHLDADGEPGPQIARNVDRIPPT